MGVAAGTVAAVTVVTGANVVAGTLVTGAAVVTGVPLVFVGALVLLVNNDQADIAQRCEHG